MSRLASSLAAVLLLSLGGAAEAASAVAPHRATYALDLVASRGQRTIADINGEMVFSWGDSCDGWTVEQRYQMMMLYTNGPEVDRSSVYATWESKDGREFNYNLRTSVDGEVDEEVRGTATLGASGGTTSFKLPEETTGTLPPGTLFPTAHTMRVLERMQGGDPFFAITLFDGTEAGTLQLLTTVVGAAIPPATAPDTDPLLAGPSRAVSMAFFNYATGGETPDYEMQIRMFENGVADDIVIDYGDFAMRAKLTTIEPLETPSCG